MLGRHLRPLIGLRHSWLGAGRTGLGVGRTGLGVVSWPATTGDRWFVKWNFWWQAHLLDCAIDAWWRAPSRRGREVVATLIRSIKLRNLGRFTNAYYDDMAWAALALQRAEALGLADRRAVRQIVTKILDAWSPPFGGIPWRIGDEFYNAPANGPAAILLARSGFHVRAGQITDWIEAHLKLLGSDLIADGFHPGEDLKPTYYSYNQGVVLGAELEMVRRGGSAARVHSLVAAIAANLTTAGVLRGHSGGDGGLFTGILARYLGLIATELPGIAPADVGARAAAARLVIRSAESAWANRTVAPAGPLFGPDWSVPAVLPDRGSTRPERDLSVQLSGWMLMEAAALLARSPARADWR